MSSLWYPLSRATGIVATILVLASLSWGFLFSARATGKRLRPAWWLDLHNWLGGLALAFSVAHVVAVLLNADAGVGLVDALVPFAASTSTAAMAWGILAFWVFVAVVATSWRPVKAKLDRRTWYGIHLVSIPAAALAVVHGWIIGSDAGTLAFQALLVLFVGLAVYPAALRLVGLVEARRA